MGEQTAGEGSNAMGERVRITATYSFEAAHWLPHVPDGHKCKRMHGHNYKIEVAVRGPLDERGFVVDYAELDAVVQPIIDRLDHRCLNDIPGLENPTSEILAIWLRDRIKASLPAFSPEIKVWETPRYCAEVT
ncbi:6-carboxytetrahydropterin synthase QueD [Hyphomicrobium sp.]|uniref:6-carboxytetrahydropterin synthase QueD n=1 Tax=Hyphomicrobium sp. TaxID=82 RepID=UPI002FE07505